jgi:hypothetical protein
MMNQSRIDLVVEAVHLTPAGQVDFVRLYERRGPAYSDRLIYNRGQLLAALRARKKVVTGVRVKGQASSFHLKDEIHLQESNGQTFLSTDPTATSGDLLVNVPFL